MKAKAKKEERPCVLCETPMKKDQRYKKDQIWVCPKCGYSERIPEGYGEDE